MPLQSAAQPGLIALRTQRVSLRGRAPVKRRHVDLMIGRRTMPVVHVGAKKPVGQVLREHREQQRRLAALLRDGLIP